MRPRPVLLFLVLAVLFQAPTACLAQDASRVHRIGFLWLGMADGTPPAAMDSFLAGLRERGFAKGDNLAIELRDGRGQPELLPRAAAELVALKVDVIVTAGTAATLAAKQATGDIPIVFGAMADPVGRGIVSSLARPGGNVTGYSRQILMDKALDVLKEVAPGARRIGLIYHFDNLPAAYRPVFLAAHVETARSLGMTLVPLAVTDTGDIDGVVAADKFEAALILNDTLLFENHARLLGLARERRIATACMAAHWVRAGCLFSYAEDATDEFRHAAGIVARILDGAKPGDLPVEQRTRFRLIVNLKMAQALGLAIPRSLLALADEVIE